MPKECWKLFKEILIIDSDLPLTIVRGHFTYWNIPGYLDAFKRSLEDFKNYKQYKQEQVEKKLVGEKKKKNRSTGDKRKSASKYETNLNRIRKVLGERMNKAQEQGILAPSIFNLLKDKSAKLLSY